MFKFSHIPVGVFVHGICGLKTGPDVSGRRLSVETKVDQAAPLRQPGTTIGIYQGRTAMRKNTLPPKKKMFFQ